MNILEWIRKSLTAWHGVFSLCLCVVFSGVLISLEHPERAVFHEVMVGTFLYPIQAVVSRLDGTLRVHRENEGLKRDNADLRVENDLLRESLRRAPRLSEMERFQAQTGARLRPGQIIAQDAGRLQMTWVIDLGRSDSVDVNMPVLTARGVVGKTVKCFRYHSVIQLLSDPAFKAAVQADRSRVRGILESYRLYQLAARFPAGADLRIGDTLITAGAGGVFPKGLRIGVVTGEIPGNEEQNSDVLRSFLIKPFQELATVEEAFVLIKEDRWRLEESP